MKKYFKEIYRKSWVRLPHYVEVVLFSELELHELNTALKIVTKMNETTNPEDELNELNRLCDYMNQNDRWRRASPYLWDNILKCGTIDPDIVLSENSSWSVHFEKK